MENKNMVIDKRTILSSLWIYLSASYIFCDVLSLMDTDFIQALASGPQLSSLNLSQEFLLGAGIMMQIPFVMIFLSRILKYKPNRVINIVAATIMVLIQIGSLLVPEPTTLHYIFYSVIEVAANIAIILIAIKWKE